MTQTEAMNILQNRYDCEIYESPWGINIYFKNLYAQINFEEDIQKFGWGNIYDKNKQIWSTGEFKESRKLNFDQFYNIFDQYFPIKKQLSLF